ncbi:hypothetical protein SAMD00019534_035250, partial [Acytostelium subglobosum LB1]|uniref:hypothetical protein n=1 Tax=Acytostelium subglobosum LB1 TaxID=1410327 RepID=UPI000644B0BF
MVEPSIPLYLSLALGTFALIWALRNYVKPSTSSDDNDNEGGRRDATERSGQIRVSKLIIYPIKSCQGIELKRVNLDKWGLENDRRWMIVQEGRFITQRKYPALANIAPSLDGMNLIVRAPNAQDLIVPINLESPAKIEVTVWKDTMIANDCGDEAATWMSNVLQMPDLRLVQMGSEHRRAIRESYARTLVDGEPTQEDLNKYQFTFADASQVMILSQSSIDDLNLRVEETRDDNNEEQRKKMDERRFRPNVLLLGTSAFEEDDWKTIRIGDALLHKVDRTGRCKFTTVDPDTAVLNPYNDNEPLRTLGKYRKDTTGEVYLGILMVLAEPGELQIGDIIDVIEKDTNK